MIPSAQAPSGPAVPAAAAVSAATEAEEVVNPTPQPNGATEEDRLVDRLLDRLGQLGLVPQTPIPQAEPEPQEQEVSWDEQQW